MRSIIVLFTAIVMAGSIVGCRKDKSVTESKTPSSQPSPEFGELVEARPIPDLARLAERSSPTYGSKDATEAFYDILKLREVGDAKAAGVLEQILAENVNTRRIHGYAAAQALFCIGTPEAHKALAKYLLTNTYKAQLGIRYTSYWQMNQSKRTPFIERYHLVNLSKDLELKLDAVKSDVTAESSEAASQFDFTLTLRNISNKAFRIQDVQVYQASMLYFQSEAGGFVCGELTALFKMGPPQWVELKTGASHRYNIQLHIRYLEEQEHGGSELSKDANLVAETADFRFILKNTGPFKVYAMFEQQPPAEAQINQLKLDNPWSGRAVSDPVAIDILLEK